uniref:Phosphoethanolamine N-methyltransferase 2 N-terminal domain-containing protein n=1 Tax=Parascaris univalens TaxID=6257 RepID=A0A914ZRS9_PARUN
METFYDCLKRAFSCVAVLKRMLSFCCCKGGTANYAAVIGEMPAAERELITSLFDVTTKDALTSVLLVTSAEQEESNSSLVALLEDRAINVTVVKRLEELQSARADAYDAIIGNKVITENCLTNKPSDLDTFVVSTLKALKKGGVLIAREDLSGYSAREKVAQLTHFFDLFRTTVNGVTIGFKFYSLKQINASIHTGGNFLDVFWTLRKEYFEALDENQKTKTFRDFLDTTQYTDESIRAYEWIFGDNFISPGEVNTVRCFLILWNENCSFNEEHQRVGLVLRCERICSLVVLVHEAKLA